MPNRRKARKSFERVIPKESLAREVSRIIEDRGWNQTEAAERIDDAPSQVSLVVNGRLDGFSPERLVRMLARLGRDVEIVIRKAKGRTGRVSVAVR